MKFKYLFTAALAITFLSGGSKDQVKEKVSVHFEHGKANAQTNFEEEYVVGEYANIKFTSNPEYKMPSTIKVTSGNELILPEKYTYVVSQDKRSADFIIKVEKSYEVVVDASEEFGEIYIGGTKISESGDYSTLSATANIKAGMISYSRETNTLKFNDASFVEADLNPNFSINFDEDGFNPCPWPFFVLLEFEPIIIGEFLGFRFFCELENEKCIDIFYDYFIYFYLFLFNITNFLYTYINATI